MKVLFHSGQLGIRGTEVAMYDYAKYNQDILGNESVIIFNSKSPINDPSAIKKFSNKFKIYSYENKSDIDKVVQLESPDLFYAIKAGNNDGIQTSLCKTGIHVVFQHFDPHGDVYAYVAKWVSEKLTEGRYPDVPHMFDMPAPSKTKDEIRKQYGIPKHAIVFGRHGGNEEFNINFALEGIIDIINSRNDVYFILVNTNRFYNHPQIIHLDKIVDMQEKSNWINACDGMIHARQMGEIFSCSIGEFCYHGKPVLSCPFTTHDIGHVKFLGDLGLWYTSKTELINLINNFNPSNINIDAYKKIVEPYTPYNVMQKFNEVYLK